MARVEITFGITGNRSAEGASSLTLKGDSAVTQVMTSSGSSQQSDAHPSPDGFGFAQIWADGDIWIVVGTNPVAVVPTSGQKLAGIRCKANEAIGLAMAKDQKLAFINI